MEVVEADSRRAPPRSVVSPLAPARWLALAILAFAPWAYGCTRSWVIPWFTATLLACTALWILGLLLRRRQPGGARVPLCLAVYLLAHGWLLVGNAGFRYDREHLQFFAVNPAVASWLPGAIDTVDAWPMMFRITGLLGLMMVAGDAACHPAWRRRVFWTVLFSGTLLALYGLLQRFSPVPLLFWEQADLSHTLFATFYYHGNAGAFMNLVLPFSFGTAVYGFAANQSPGTRALGVATLFLNLAATVAIASKAAQGVTVILLVVLVMVYRREIFRSRAHAAKSKAGWFVGAALIIVCVGALVLMSDMAQERWAFLPRLLSFDNVRLLADKACLRMLPDAGFWGIGPGNFAIAFPHYTYGLPDVIMGIWSYAHQDYLQTVIEWGWVGAAAWTVILLGAGWKGYARARPNTSEALRPESLLIYRSTWIALLGVSLHALVDFPLQVGSIQAYVMISVGLLWHDPFAAAGEQQNRRRSEKASRVQRNSDHRAELGNRIQNLAGSEGAFGG